jgi:hypothetical protein
MIQGPYLTTARWRTELAGGVLSASGGAMISLPVPRLEVRWEQDVDTPTLWACTYQLITTSPWDQELLITPIGRRPRWTHLHGSPIRLHGWITVPLELRAMCRHQARELHLPAYAICGEMIQELWPLAEDQDDARTSNPGETPATPQDARDASLPR